MSVTARRGPEVGEREVRFELRDPKGALRAVALLHELRRPRRIPFGRRTTRGPWRLTLPRPDADRFEYLFELTRAGGGTEVVPDPGNPLRAAGPFGEKSVVELPGYEPPEWVEDDEAPTGDLRPLELRAGRTALPALLWSAAETDPAEPLPLVVVHDGPEYAQYSGLLRLLDHLHSFGEVPPLRAALLPPPPDRNEVYSASTRYARRLAAQLLPAVLDAAPAPDEARFRVGIGASLGALAMLHAHALHPTLFGALFLQSGSFFQRRLDPYEADFGRFVRITRFVGGVRSGRSAPRPIPVTLTCGTAEENLANNRAVARALARRDYDVELVENRDAHNWTAWRDALHPHLAELLLRAWT